MAQGLSQRPGIDYDETYAPVVDATTFRYLISLVVHARLDLRLMDVVIVYLYGSLDSEIYMKIQERFKIHEEYLSSQEHYSIRLNNGCMD